MSNKHPTLIAALEHFGWPAQQAGELARGAHVVPYDKNATVFHAGEAADLIYVLLGGEVRLLYGPRDPGVLVGIAQRGDLLGVFAPDDGVATLARAEQLFTARALSRCSVAILPTARVAHVLRALPPAQLVRVLERGRERWAHLSCRLLSYLTMTVRQRLVHAISEIAEAFGSGEADTRRIALRLSHDDLAALVGASRPVVSKHLKALTREGLLSKQQGRFVLHQPTAAVPHLRRVAGRGEVGAEPSFAAGAAGDRGGRES
jgi:CRP/FNR family transcriptional regulator